MEHTRLLIYLTLTVFSFYSCSLTKGLPEDAEVVRKINLNLEAPSSVKLNTNLKANLLNEVLFSPTRGIATSRVYIYNNVNKKGKEKGIARWIQSYLGIAPELFKARQYETSQARMVKYLIDHGHFSSSVKSDTTKQGQLIDISYQVYTTGRYKIDSVSGLNSKLFKNLTRKQRSFIALSNSDYYDKEKLDFLRAESVHQLRNQGYFNVTQDQFYFYLDTVPGNQEVDIYFQYTDPIHSGEKKYQYRSTSVYSNYNLSDTHKDKALVYSGDQIKLYSDTTIFKPKLFSRLIKSDSAKFYSPKEDRQLMSRLRETGVFKFVNLEYDTMTIDKINYIDRRLNLTPGTMRNIGFEFQVNSTNGNALGSEISSTFQHQNVFGGAEKLKIKASVGGEFQTSSSTQTGIFNTYNVVTSAGLGFPGLIGFGKDRYLSKGPTIPRSSFILSNQFQVRNDFYQINSSDFSYSYKIGTSTENHQLSPISLDYVYVQKKTARLDSIFLTNPRLAESLQNVFIFSTNYIYYHASPIHSKKKGGYYYSFQGGIESAGGLLSLITKKKNDKPATVLSVPYSQYVKGDIEYLPKYAIGDHIIAGRISLGLGLPYGNSRVLPYIKQYFVGGASSLRAFDIRTLGPGGYITKNNDTGTNFLDQTGDIKIELNLEYRFPIFSYLKGAAFIDAGNVWLAKNRSLEIDPDLGIFDPKDFYKELGIGIGIGFRIDFDITVLRFDFATPIFDPRNELGWTLKGWNKNKKFRIGIGYPF